MTVIIGIGLVVAFILGLFAVTVGLYYLIYVPCYYTYWFFKPRINSASTNDPVGGFILKSILLVVPIVVFIIAYPILTPFGTIICSAASVMAFFQAPAK